MDRREAERVAREAVRDRRVRVGYGVILALLLDPSHEEPRRLECHSCGLLWEPRGFARQWRPENARRGYRARSCRACHESYRRTGRWGI